MVKHSVLHHYGSDLFKDQHLNLGYNITGAIQPEILKENGLQCWVPILVSLSMRFKKDPPWLWK